MVGQIDPNDVTSEGRYNLNDYAFLIEFGGIITDVLSDLTLHPVMLYLTGFGNVHFLITESFPFQCLFALFN